jgi:Fur family zinc uptake transcriptional regulator
LLRWVVKLVSSSFLPATRQGQYDSGMTEKKSRLSNHNQQVLTLLRQSSQPLTAYAILDGLRAEGIKAPTTVYRALSALTQQGLAHRIESLNAYLACQHHEDDHAHAGEFAICTKCGTVQELDLSSVSAQLQKASKNFLASMHHKIVELSGICHACAEGDNQCCESK